MINTQTVIEKTALLTYVPSSLHKGFQWLVGRVMCERIINDFLSRHHTIEGREFVEEALEHLDVAYIVSDKDKERIPTHGRVVIIANHPLGGLDGLALLKMVLEVRNDVKIVANDILSAIEQLQPFFIGVDLYAKSSKRQAQKEISQALEKEEAVIFFPAAKVSRWGWKGVQDGKWSKGFLHFATKSTSPILPIFVDAKNSSLFYGVSLLSQSLSALLLPREMLKRSGKAITFRIGDMIPPIAFLGGIEPKEQLRLFRKHLYGLKNNRKKVFPTIKNIAKEERPQEIIAELHKGQLLGKTHDGKAIYLCAWQKNSPLLRELGRLRELSFRKVGEGSGKKRDNDSFDSYYKHLVLWDENTLEIVGSYRLGVSSEILSKLGKEGFYSHTLFRFKSLFDYYLVDSIELGRSFVQPRYWGTRALDYLWQGLGAYLRANPHIKTLFGPVSLSNDYPLAAKEAIIYYYAHYFGSQMEKVVPICPFSLSTSRTEELNSYFNGNNATEDMRLLKEYLKCFGRTVPTLYKHYTELVDEGGVQFCGFTVDLDFGHCIDGLLVLDVSRIKVAKRERYMG